MSHTHDFISSALYHTGGQKMIQCKKKGKEKENKDKRYISSLKIMQEQKAKGFKESSQIYCRMLSNIPPPTPPSIPIPTPKTSSKAQKTLSETFAGCRLACRRTFCSNRSQEKRLNNVVSSEETLLGEKRPCRDTTTHLGPRSQELSLALLC